MKNYVYNQFINDARAEAHSHQINSKETQTWKLKRGF